MFKILVIFLCFTFGLFSKEITSDDVYSQVELIGDEIHFLLNYYNIEHHHEEIIKSVEIDTNIKPRNVWQKTYEILIKINIIRANYKFPSIEPIAMPPILNLNPDLVYEQTQRILTEFKILEVRLDIETPKFELQSFKNKTSLDVFMGLSHLSLALDELSQSKLTQSYIFSESMRIYDDILLILNKLNIDDNTIPTKKNINATIEDSFNIALKTLEKIKQLQISVGMDFVDFSRFNKENITISDVFSLSQMIISELQPIKAYLGITTTTSISSPHEKKTQIEVEQIMQWNLRKLNLINSLIVAK